MKNAVKLFFHMGYGTAISDKIDKKFTPPPRPPPPPPPPPPQFQDGKMARFGAVSRGFIPDLEEGGRGWWFAGHFILSKVLARTHIQPRPLGCKGCCLNF